MPFLEGNEITQSEPRNPSALRWAIGSIVAATVLFPFWLSLVLVGWTYAAVAWSGFKASVGY